MSKHDVYTIQMVTNVLLDENLNLIIHTLYITIARSYVLFRVILYSRSVL